MGWYDLDFNWHLSNTHYLGLLFNSIPSAFLRDHFPTHILIHYKQEAQLDDIVNSQSLAIKDNHFRHRLLRADQVIAEGTSTWQSIHL